MVWSKTCKIGTFIAISASAVVVLIIVINVTTRLCENKNELFDRLSNKCHAKQSRIPCNDTRNLVFSEESLRSQYGQCACPPSERSMLYHKPDKHCYLIFSQGFCKEGEWLNVVTSTLSQDYGKPFCEPNRCLHLFNETDVPEEVVPLKDGKCGILNRRAEGCKENETVRFYSNHILPGCEKPKSSKPKMSSVGVPASSCPLGSYPSITGKCQPDFDFDK